MLSADENHICQRDNNVSENDSGGTTADECNRRKAMNGYKNLAALVILFVVVLFFRANVFDVVTVVGDSMANSFSQGDVLVINKLNTVEISRYDVVVAKAAEIKVIKRVIGMPGETVQIVNGVVLIDGKELQKEYAVLTERAGIAGDPYVLGVDEYFLLGDNRSGSCDSRDFGAVKRNNISGVAALRVLPISDFQIIGMEGP